MGAHNIQRKIEEGRIRRTLALAADTTLTIQQVLDNDVIEIDTTDNTVAVTLPAASAAIAGRQLTVKHKLGANAGTVVVAAGYGSAGSGSDTLTTAAGEAVIVGLDKAGAYWDELHNEPAG